MLRLGWGTPAMITAELALVFEWGASSRRALMGQLHAAFPPKLEKPGKKFLELNIDALGIWDSQTGRLLARRARSTTRTSPSSALGRRGAAA